jgi:hypothetical protein
MVNIFKKIRQKQGITLVEIVIASSLFLLLMVAAYRLFFAEVLSIRTALEHIGVNESARRFFAHFGNDIRNANWVEFPEQTNRQTVSVLPVVSEGKVCTLLRQVMDFQVKPPDPAFLKIERIEYYLKKAKDGSSDLYKKVYSETRGDPTSRKKVEFEKMICDGVKDLVLYRTIRKPATISNFSAAVPFKNLLSYEPYDLDGTGPYLVHVRATFVRKGKDRGEGGAHHVKTSFCVRGKLNGVHP